MAVRQHQGQLEVIAACSVEALSANSIADVLGRVPQSTKALADRLVDSGDLDWVAHTTRAGARLYRASAKGLGRLAAEPATLEPNTYVVLIEDQLPPTAASVLAIFVREEPPMWMFRMHGSYRLVVAYADSTVADALERRVTRASSPTAAIVVHADQLRFPSQVEP